MTKYFDLSVLDSAEGVFLPYTYRQFKREFVPHFHGRQISGAQPKVTMYLKTDPSHTHASECVIKPSPGGFTALAEVEFATMQVMKALRFEVPPIWLANFAPEESEPLKRAFIIKRFDRGELEKPIHQEQLDAAMNATDKYGQIDDESEHSMISYERVYHFLSKHITDTSGLSYEFYKRIVCAYLLGNSDLHLRNFALVYSKQGDIKLAPIYDYVAVCAYPFIMSDTMALPLRITEEAGGAPCQGRAKHDVYTGKDFIEFGQSIGLSAEEAENYLDELFHCVPKIIELYKRAQVPADQLEFIEQWINRIAYHFIEYR